MSIHTILSQEIVSDKTNRIYVRSKKYPNGGLIMGEEVDKFLKHLATRIVEETKREEREKLHKAFISNYRGAGEIWIFYESKGNCTKEEELEAVENEWEKVIESIK